MNEGCSQKEEEKLNNHAQLHNKDASYKRM